MAADTGEKQALQKAREARELERQKRADSLRKSRLMVEGDGFSNRKEKPPLRLTDTVLPQLNLSEELAFLKRCIQLPVNLRDPFECNLKKYALLGTIARVFEMAKRLPQGPFDDELARVMRNNLFHKSEHLLLPLAKSGHLVKATDFSLELITFVAEFLNKKLPPATLRTIGEHIKCPLLPYFIGDVGSEKFTLQDCIGELSQSKAQLEQIEREGLRNPLLKQEAEYYLIARIDAFRKTLNEKVGGFEVILSPNQTDIKLSQEEREIQAMLLEAKKLLADTRHHSVSGPAKPYRHEDRTQLQNREAIQQQQQRLSELSQEQLTELQLIEVDMGKSKSKLGKK